MFDYQAPELLLKNRVILITGAGDGIGRAAAKTFAKYGATLILAGKTTHKLEAVYDEIEQSGGAKPAIVPINLETATEHDYVELSRLLEQEFQQLDGILHNASLLGSRTNLASYDSDTWQQVMQVNLNAAFMLTQNLMPMLLKSSDASVVFTSSGVGRKGRANWGAYSVSKFATEGLMQVLSDECSENNNIRVNCINPGATRTKMRAAAYPNEDPNTLATPEDIMPLYLYFMGKDSEGITGQSLDAQ